MQLSQSGKYDALLCQTEPGAGATAVSTVSSLLHKRFQNNEMILAKVRRRSAC